MIRILMSSNKEKKLFISRLLFKSSFFILLLFLFVVSLPIPVKAIDGVMNGKTITGLTDNYLFWLQTYDPDTAPYFFDKLFVNKEGNVGIGTTNPALKLDVSGTFRNTLSTTHSLLGGAGNAVVMADNTGTLYSTSTDAFISSNSLGLWSGTKNGAIWNGDAGVGNVGIGTTNPANKLSIQGVTASDTTPPPVNLSLRATYGTGTSQHGIGFYVNTSSYLGSGIFAPPGALSFFTSSSHSTADAVERMRITNTGNVGIGITNPTKKLDVVGNININEGSAYLYDGVQALKLDKGTDTVYANTYVGYDSGSGAQKQTALGYYAGYLNTGAYQSALGYYAGRENTGAYQTALGYWAGYLNTGHEQTAVGYKAGQSNSGEYQSALGLHAGQSNSGDNQTAVGYQAGQLNIGTRQTAVGRSSGGQNTGANQTVLGYGAGYQNTGANQTALGHAAGGDGSSGANQTAIGYIAGYQNTGDDQIVVGYYAGYRNTGDRVTGVGYEAARSNIVDDVVAVGYQAGKDNTVANQFIVKQNNINTTPLIQGDFASGNVGIGTASSTTKLDVSGTFRNTLATTHSLLGGAGNAVVMSDNTGTLYSTGLDTFLSSNTLWSGTRNGNIWNGDAGVGNVGIGTTNPGAKLDIYGTDNELRLSYDVTNYTKLSTNSTGGATFSTVGSSPSLYFKPASGRTYFNGSGVNNEFYAYDYSGASPYPYLALSAHNLTFVNAGTGNKVNIVDNGNSWLNGGNLGIGTTDPSQKLDVAGTFRNTLSTTHSLLGGAGNAVVMSDNTGTLYSTSTDAFISSNSLGLWSGTKNGNIWNGDAGVGNVGIGTTNPGQKLEVAAIAYGPNQSNGIRLNDTGNHWSFDLNIKSNSGGVPRFSIDTYTASDVFTILSGGNVGIGTTNPISPLYVLSDSGVATPLTVQRNASASNVAIEFKDNTASWFAGKSSNGNFAIHTSASLASAPFNINTSGNVGIGTTNPSQKLDVQGNLAIGSNVLGGGSIYGYSGGASYATLKMYDTANGYTFLNNQGYGIRLQTAGNDRVTIMNGGNVGIGTSNPLGLLHLNIGEGLSFNHDGDYYGTAQDARLIRIVDFNGTNGSADGGITIEGYTSTDDVSRQLMTIRGNGRVGIGTTTPAYYLDVAGTANFDGLAYGVTPGTSQTYALTTVEYVDNAISGVNGSTVGYWTASGNNIYNANSANVGIGSTAPANKLDITGNFGVNGIFKGYGSTNGNFFEGKLGVNSLSAGASSLAIFGNASIGTAYLSTAAPTNGLLVQGNVGVGTTTPAAALHVADNVKIDGGLTLAGNLSMAASTLIVNKITANTIDPLYTISGNKYSTFAPSVVGGVKEEYVGRVKASDFNQVGAEYEAVLDFSSVAEGSDLWVWYQVVDFNSDNVEVFLTPNGQRASMYAYVEGSEVVIRSDKAVDAYLRLVGKRYDWRKWPTKAFDQNQEGGLLVK